MSKLKQEHSSHISVYIQIYYISETFIKLYLIKKYKGNIMI